MTIDELNELKDDVMAWQAAWGGFKCPSTARLHRSQENMKQIIALIDDAIARIDSTDSTRVSEDVQAAIDYFNEVLPYMGGDRGLVHFETAITALRAYREPVGGEIANCHFLADRGDYWAWQEPDEANHIESMVDRSYVMIRVDRLRPMYQALRQMKGE